MLPATLATGSIVVKRLDLAGLTATAEVIGTIGIIVSLVFVAYSVNSNTNAVKASQTNVVYEASRQIELAVASDPEFEKKRLFRHRLQFLRKRAVDKIDFAEFLQPASRQDSNIRLLDDCFNNNIVKNELTLFLLRSFRFLFIRIRLSESGVCKKAKADD